MTLGGRVMAMWFPQWAVVSALAEAGESTSHLAVLSDLAALPVVVVRANRVVGVSPAAQADGVSQGLRLREAQGRCPQARVLRADEGAEARAFSGVLDVLEQVVVGVEVVHPGLCIVPARGPTRFYGGEGEAIGVVTRALESGAALATAAGLRVGVADDVFTAVQAARTSLPSPVVVAAGRSRDFLAPLPIERLDDPEMVLLLQRLGVASFGDFAALPADVVEARLGRIGAVLHERVCGLDQRGIRPRPRHEDLALRLRWDEPIEREDQLAFAVRESVGRLVDGLAERRLVATAVRVELLSDGGGISDRLWSHPQCFDAAGIIDRVRWQVQAAARDAANGGPGGPAAGGRLGVGFGGSRGVSGAEPAGSPDSGSRMRGLDGGIVQVTIIPERVDEAFRFERPLFGAGADDRVAQGIARVQSIVGHDGVLVARLGGGRLVRDRRVFVPWGETVPEVRGDGPWPGRLPSPAPSLVYAERVPARVWDSAGALVSVDERGRVSNAPAVFDVVPPGGKPRRHRVEAWAGPWPVAGRWWDSALGGEADSARVDRFQCVDDEGVGWLLIVESEQWWVEGRYD